MMYVAPAMTGLRALNTTKKQVDKKDGGTVVPAFMPGQRSALASQLNQGFGGGQAQWNSYLGDIYSPYRADAFVPGLPPTRPDNKKGDGKGGGGKDGKGGGGDAESDEDKNPGDLNSQARAASQLMQALPPRPMPMFGGPPPPQLTPQMIGLLALRNGRIR